MHALRIDQGTLFNRGSADFRDAGKWKQSDTWVHFPSSWIRTILERFASGETTLPDADASHENSADAERNETSTGAKS
jgi:hypothetical protein